LNNTQLVSCTQPSPSGKNEEPSSGLRLFGKTGLSSWGLSVAAWEIIKIIAEEVLGGAASDLVKEYPVPIRVTLLVVVFVVLFLSYMQIPRRYSRCITAMCMVFGGGLLLYPVIFPPHPLPPTPTPTTTDSPVTLVPTYTPTPTARAILDKSVENKNAPGTIISRQSRCGDGTPPVGASTQGARPGIESAAGSLNPLVNVYLNSYDSRCSAVEVMVVQPGSALKLAEITSNPYAWCAFWVKEAYVKHSLDFGTDLASNSCVVTAKQCSECFQ
jgi:hypothetical protein